VSLGRLPLFTLQFSENLRVLGPLFLKSPTSANIQHNRSTNHCPLSQNGQKKGIHDGVGSRAGVGKSIGADFCFPECNFDFPVVLADGFAVSDNKVIIIKVSQTSMTYWCID
jgi:hypothetical protein